jgi:hypothetical protein
MTNHEAGISSFPGSVIYWKLNSCFKNRIRNCLFYSAGGIAIGTALFTGFVLFR